MSVQDWLIRLAEGKSSTSIDIAESRKFSLRKALIPIDNLADQHIYSYKSCDLNASYLPQNQNKASGPYGTKFSLLVMCLNKTPRR